jgi:hypothetical protein
MLPAKFGSIWTRSFRGEDLIYISQSETWPTRAIRFSDWLLLKKSPLKLLGQMEPNLAGSIYARSSIKFIRFIPFGQQITRIALGSHICWQNGTKRRNFIENLT